MILSKPLTILSIQSSVAYGHVGNSAAVFSLQRIGVEVWPVNTVQFSNHTGYGNWRGVVFPADSISDVIRGISERNVMNRCDGVLSGYMGDVSVGEVILDAFKKVTSQNPQALYCCDPVLGDVGRGIFVREEIPQFIKEKAIPLATMVTPNQFELEYLTDTQVTDFDSAIQAAQAIRKRGPKIVLITSLRTNDLPPDQIEVVAVGENEIYSIRTPLLPLDVNGAGDMAAALFFAHWLRTGSIRMALEKTINTVYCVLETTVREQSNELLLIAAQDLIQNPPTEFRSIQCCSTGCQATLD
jgi:pyridoxine kinase